MYVGFAEFAATFRATFDATSSPSPSPSFDDDDDDDNASCLFVQNKSANWASPTESLL